MFNISLFNISTGRYKNHYFFIIFLGVAHGEDLFLILPQNFRDDAPMNENELLMASNLLDMFIEFSKNERITFGNVDLKVLANESLNFLEIFNPKIAKINKFNNFGNEAFWDQTIKFDMEN